MLNVQNLMDLMVYGTLTARRSADDILKYFLSIIHLGAARCQVMFRFWLICVFVPKYCEYCSEPYVKSPKNAVTDLNLNIHDKFFGQHIAASTALAAISGHLYDPNPTKPLVLSFHGGTGLGKSHVARIIASSLFSKGVDSSFVKFYSASKDFPVFESEENSKSAARVEEYQNKIETDVKNALERCRHALFVFDEVDMMAPQVLDILVPFLDRDSFRTGLDQNKAIYIFLTNQGGESINDITRTKYEMKISREDLTFLDFELTVKNEVFNAETGGFRRARVLLKSLVDHIIPFMPMERRHVVQCIAAENKRLKLTLDPGPIADTLTYWPKGSKLYSVDGCKQVEKRVSMFGKEDPFKNHNKKSEL